MPMPAGCPSCASEGTPSNVAPVYGRMTPLRPGKATGPGMARYLTQLPVGRDRLVTMGEGDTPLLATQALGPRPVTLHRRGEELAEIESRFQTWNATVEPDGTVALAS